LDSGCTAHFLIANAHCRNKLLSQSPLEFHLPNGSIIASTYTVTLDPPSFPTADMQSHILPGLAQHSLLSVGQMRDSGCVITFTANKVTIKHGAAKFLTGTRVKDSGLWRSLLGNTNSEQSEKTQHTMSMKKVYPRHNYVFTCMLLQSCARHLANIYSKWALCNMAIIGNIQYA
jgi:hypothetical protein